MCHPKDNGCHQYHLLTYTIIYSIASSQFWKQFLGFPISWVQFGALKIASIIVCLLFQTKWIREFMFRYTGPFSLYLSFSISSFCFTPVWFWRIFEKWKDRMWKFEPHVTGCPGFSKIIKHLQIFPLLYKQTEIFPNFLLYGAFNFNHVHAKALRIMIFTEF